MAEPLQPSLSTESRPRPIRLLVAEDDESMRLYLSNLFRINHLEADLASDGEEVLVRVKVRDYDILLLDQKMPGLTGMEVLARIQQEGPRIPVIILSGQGSEELAVEALQRGATDYATKIPDARFGDVLIEKIYRAIERYAQQEEQRQGLEMLRQRMTELGCLYALEKLFESVEGSPSVALTSAANIIRPTCSDRSCAIIRIGKEEYSSDGVFSSLYSESFAIRERDKIIGELEIRFSDEPLPKAALTDLDRDLMIAVADRIGHFMDFWHTEQRLRESNAALEEYAYVASHDLQAPLQKIQSFVNILLEEYGPQLDEQGRQYLSVILKSAQQMRRLIKDVLALARLDSGGLVIKDVDLNTVLAQVRDTLSARIVERNAVLQIQTLPTIRGDETRLFQLFQNLINNSLKFNDKPEPRIVVGAEEEDEHWRLFVQDNGIGMTREDAARLFVPFKRLHSAERFEGTGIGLALCRKIVRQHSGTIEAEGKPGEGALFLIRLPKLSLGMPDYYSVSEEGHNAGGCHVEHHG